MASNPRNLTISGVFLAFPRFFATMRFADTECRKKDIISKNGSLQDVEQLSPAAKAQSPFLRAESAAFRVAKAFCSTFCPFFVFLYVKYLCLPERRLVIGYIYKKEDCDCRYYFVRFFLPQLLTKSPKKLDSIYAIKLFTCS